jgi:transposase InsO family protein
MTVLPFFEEHGVTLLRVLTDRGSEFCGNPERHEYELYLAVEDIDHSRTKTKSRQTNGICERFHKTALNEFYRVAFRKKVYRSTDECRRIWTRGSKNTMRHGHIRDARPRSRPIGTRIKLKHLYPATSAKTLRHGAELAGARARCA